MIAIAIACNPRLLIADEPTTALDVTVQAQILALLGRLIADHRMGLLLITHDLGVVADTCATTNVMYGGRVVESAPTRQLFRQPAHPYTVALLRSIPKLDGDRKVRLAAIDGQPPVLRAEPVGCTFAARCPRSLDRCRTDTPTLEANAGGRAACWNPVPDAWTVSMTAMLEVEDLRVVFTVKGGGRPRREGHRRRRGVAVRRPPRDRRPGRRVGMRQEHVRPRPRAAGAVRGAHPARRRATSPRCAAASW